MNIFSVLSMGKSRLHETSMSAMLAYLLNPNQDHGVGNKFLKSFLELSNENVDLSKLSMFITKKQADISKGNFIAMVCNEQSQNFMSEFDFENIDKNIEYVEAMIPTPINQITASDHLNFWKFGYKAIMITDTAHFRNPNYHTANDTLETLDVNKMQCVVNLVVESIKEMTKNKDFFN